MDTLQSLFLFMFNGAIILASLDMIGLYVFSGIHVGEDFYMSGSGYADYRFYWARVRSTAIRGAVLGAIAFALTLLV